MVEATGARLARLLVLPKSLSHRRRPLAGNDWKPAMCLAAAAVGKKRHAVSILTTSNQTGILWFLSQSRMQWCLPRLPVTPAWPWRGNDSQPLYPATVPTGQPAWGQLANGMAQFADSAVLERKQRQPHAQRQPVRHLDFSKTGPEPSAAPPTTSTAEIELRAAQWLSVAAHGSPCKPR